VAVPPETIVPPAGSVNAFATFTRPTPRFAVFDAGPVVAPFSTVRKPEVVLA
jgi:hypothetical protein